MLIPIGHTGAIRRLPIVTISLIVLNTVIFLFTIEPIKQTQNNVVRADVALFQYEESIMRKYDLDLWKQVQSHEKVLNLKESLKSRREFRRQIKEGLVIRESDPEYKQWNELYNRYESALDKAFLQDYGFVPSKFNIVGLFTSMYLHGGWFHLIFNMLFLWVVGGALEDKWGIPLFIVFYHLGGVFAAFSHALADLQSVVPSLGASGAISAAMGAFLIRHFKTRIKFLFFLGFAGKFSIPAWMFLPFWLAEQLFFAATDTIGSGVAVWAHIGGFVFGVLFALFMGILSIEEKYLQPAVKPGEEEKVWKKEDAPVKQTLDHNVEIGKDLMSKGKYNDAIISINAALHSNPYNLDALKLLYFAYLKIGEVQKGVSVAATMIEKLIIDRRYEDAVDVYREVKKADPTAVFAMRVQYNLGNAMKQLGHYSDAARVYYEYAVTYPDNQLAPKTLFLAAEIMMDNLGNKSNAVKILQYLNSRYPTNNHFHQAQQMLAQLTGNTGGGGEGQTG